MTCTSSQMLLGDQSRRMRWAGHVACIRERREIHMLCMEGKSDGKKLVGRPRCSSENIFKVDLQEMGWDGME